MRDIKPDNIVDWFVSGESDEASEGAVLSQPDGGATEREAYDDEEESDDQEDG